MRKSRIAVASFDLARRQARGSGNEQGWNKCYHIINAKELRAFYKRLWSAL